MLGIVAGGIMNTGRAALVFQFDYSLDTLNFFDTQAKKDVFEAAGQAIIGNFGDTLSSITPGGINTWTANITRPDDGSPFSISNPTIPANTLVVYAGGRNLGGNVLGEAGPGGFSGSGTSAFLASVAYRGQDANGATQSAATSTDFGPWGGQAAFTTDPSVSWNYTLSQPTAGQADFYSVALHELTHLLGFVNPQPSQAHWVTPQNTFNGPVATAQNGGMAVPLYGAESGGNNSHIGTTVSSQVASSTISQTPSMTATLLLGDRKEMTKLDFAVLDDVGWDVNPIVYQNAVPEPSEFIAISGVGLAAFAVLRRRKKT